MPGPLDGLLKSFPSRALTPLEQAEQDRSALASQAQDPAWKRYGRQALEGGTDALLGLIGLGSDTTMNQVGQLAGAALPLGMIGKQQWLRTPNLPMDDASRMARATEQGYTTPVYHGTRSSANFPEFANPVSRVNDFGIHVTPDPETAFAAAGARELHNTGYIGPTHARILPLQARMQKTLELPDIGAWNQSRAWREHLTDPRTKNMVGIGEFDARIPTNDVDTARALHTLASDHRATISKNTMYPYPDEGANKIAFQQKLLELLKSKGYDSISYKNYAEGAGEPSYLLLDPGQLKSRFARFDPAAFGKTKDILAGLSGVAVASHLAKDK